MRWTVVFCILALALISGCGLIEELQGTAGEVSELQLTPNTDIQSTANKLLFPDNDCLFPCFAGLYPGESSVEEVEEFIGRFNVDNSAIQLDPFEGGYGLSLFPEPRGLLLIDFVVEEGILSYTTVGISSVHDWLSQAPYNLPNLFSTYGEPDVVRP